MATISNRSLIGPEAKVRLETSFTDRALVDRSDWIIEITYDVNPNTADDTPLNHTDQKMIHIDRTTSGRIVWRTQEAANEYINDWLGRLNDQRQIVIREQGDGTNKPETTIDVLLTGTSKNVQRDSMQSIETPFHGNSISFDTQ